MPAKLDVDREAVKTLVVAVGCSEASRQTGIPLNTVLAWSARGRWLKPPAPPPSMIQPAIGAIKPGLALQNIIEERKELSRGHLSKYVVDASQKAANSKGNLALAQQVRHVAATHNAVWPVQQQVQTNVMVNLALIGS